MEHELIGNIVPYDGHVIWMINKNTLEVEKAKYSNATYHFEGENKKEIIVKDGYAYVSALNKKNALKKYKKGQNGGRELGSEKLLFYNV